MTDPPENPLDAVATLIAAARNTAELDAKVLYIATARGRFSACEDRVQILRTSLSAIEKDLVRLSKERS